MKSILITLFFLNISLAFADQSVRPWLGVAIGKGEKGVFVKMALPSTPAHAAGIRKGDEVISVDGKKVKLTSELIKAVAMTGVGNTAHIILLRDGKEIKKDIVLVAKPELTKVVKDKFLGKKTAAFELDVLQGSDKKKVTNKDLEGKVTLLEFWSTTCSACHSAQLRLIQFANKYNGKINMVSISRDKKPPLKKYLAGLTKALEKHKEQNKIIFLRSPDGKINGEYFANTIPMFILLDKKGTVVDVGVGAGIILENIISKAVALL